MECDGKEEEVCGSYTTVRNSGIYFVIYILKIVPDQIPSMNAPRNLPHAGKCLVSERRLAGTNRQKASFSLLSSSLLIGYILVRLFA